MARRVDGYLVFRAGARQLAGELRQVAGDPASIPDGTQVADVTEANLLNCRLQPITLPGSSNVSVYRFPEIAFIGVPAYVFIGNCHMTVRILAFVDFPSLYIPDATAFTVQALAERRPGVVSEAE